MSAKKHTVIDLPEDVVLSVRGVSKKFCRNLRRSMWYGIQDLSKNLMGFSSNPETADCRLQTADLEEKTTDCRLQTADLAEKTTDCRPQTADFLGGSASGAEDADIAPAGGSKGLQSAVCGLQSNSDGLRPSEFWALRNVSFDLRRGECLGLIGRNGCGKTTLLRLIAGIFPPDRGEIAIRGRVGGMEKS